MDGWNTSFLLGWPVFGGELLVLGRALKNHSCGRVIEIGTMVCSKYSNLMPASYVVDGDTKNNFYVWFTLGLFMEKIPNPTNEVIMNTFWQLKEPSRTAGAEPENRELTSLLSMGSDMGPWNKWPKINGVHFSRFWKSPYKWSESFTEKSPHL